jgi:hypothetical protein
MEKPLRPSSLLSFAQNHLSVGKLTVGSPTLPDQALTAGDSGG